MMNQSNADSRTLWIGDIEPWMNEKHLEDVFSKVGRIMSVKLIRSKETNLPAGYCFVEFQTHDQAERVLMNYNSQPIPGAQGTFRMNWGKNPTNTGIIKPITTPTGYPNTGYNTNMMQQGMGQQMVQMTPPAQEFSVYVGELELGVNELQLAEHFRGKYQSVTSAKIITDPGNKLSKGYGFVKFSNTVEGQRAIHEMNGSIFKGKFIKVSQAVSRQQAQMPGQTPSLYPQTGYGDVYAQQYAQQYGQAYGQGVSQYQPYDYYSNYAQQNGQSQYPYSYSQSYYGQTATDPSLYASYPQTATPAASQYGQYANQSSYYPQTAQTQSTAYGNSYAQVPVSQTSIIHDTYQHSNPAYSHQHTPQQPAVQQIQPVATFQQPPIVQQPQLQQLHQQQQLNQVHPLSSAHQLQQPSSQSSQSVANQQTYNQVPSTHPTKSLKDEVPNQPKDGNKSLLRPNSEFVANQADYVSVAGEIEFTLSQNL